MHEKLKEVRTCITLLHTASTKILLKSHKNMSISETTVGIGVSKAIEVTIPPTKLTPLLPSRSIVSSRLTSSVRSFDVTKPINTARSGALWFDRTLVFSTVISVVDKNHVGAEQVVMIC